MSAEFATIQFLPVCSNCGRIIYDIIDITEVPLADGIATIPHDMIEPRQCKRCGAFFENITVPNRFPFNNKKEFSISEQKVTIMQVANKICPRCHNANYVRYLGELSDSYKYKCINCNAYLNDEDFEKPTLNNSENNKKMNYGGLISFEDMNKIFTEMRERQEDCIIRTIEKYLDPIIETKINEKISCSRMTNDCPKYERKVSSDE